MFALLSASVAAWSVPVNVSNTPGNGLGNPNVPAVAADSAGNIYAVWDSYLPSNQDIFISKSTDGGVTWSFPFDVSNNSGNSYHSTIFIDAGNNVHLVWADETPGNVEIFYSKSTDGGVTWSAAANVSNSAGTSYVPAIAVDSSNNVHVVWFDDMLGNFDIFYSNSTDGGTTWSPAVDVSNTGDFSGGPRIAIDSNRSLHVVWLDATPGNYEIFYSKSTDGGTTWSAAVNLSNNSVDSQISKIAVDSGDNLHVVWGDNFPDNAEIVYSKSVDGGATWSPAVNISNTSSGSDSPSMAINSSGGIHVVWHDYIGGNDETFYSGSSDGGTTWSPVINVSNNYGPSYNPAVAVDSGGNVHAVWNDQASGFTQIVYSKSTDGGATWSAITDISKSSRGTSESPEIAVDSANNIYLVWQDDAPANGDIFCSKSADGGATWSAPVNVSNNYGYSGYAAIDLDSSNNLHVVWQDTTPENVDILYSKSSDGGVTWSSTVDISNDSGSSYLPAIAVDLGNNIHVVWYGLVGGDGEVFYSKSTDGGATWSAAVNVSKTTTSSQEFAIAVDSGTNIHVAWVEYLPGNPEIFYSKSTDGGITWNAAVNVSKNSGSVYSPAIAVDSSNNPYILWQGDALGNFQIFISKSTDGGVTWSAPAVVFDSIWSGEPAIIVGPGDILHATWHDWTPGNEEIFYSKSTDGGTTWSAPINVSNTSGNSMFPAIALGPSGNLHFAWMDTTPGNNEIFYSTDNPVSAAGSSTGIGVVASAPEITPLLVILAFALAALAFVVRKR